LLCVSFVFSPQVFSFCISPCIVWCYSYYYGPSLPVDSRLATETWYADYCLHLPRSVVASWWSQGGSCDREVTIIHVTCGWSQNKWQIVTMVHTASEYFFCFFCAYFVFVVLSFIYRFVSLVLEVFLWLKKKSNLALAFWGCDSKERDMSVSWLQTFQTRSTLCNKSTVYYGRLKQNHQRSILLIWF